MKFLSLNFQIFTLCSYWLPDKSSRQFSLAYSVYNFTIVSLFFGLLAMKAYTIVTGKFESFDDFAVVTFLFPELTISFLKSLNTIDKRKQLLAINRELMAKCHLRRDKTEDDLHEKYDRISR